MIALLRAWYDLRSLANPVGELINWLQGAAKGFARLTFVVGACALATSVSYLGDFGNATDYLLIATGAVLIPVWMVLSGRTLAKA